MCRNTTWQWTNSPRRSETWKPNIPWTIQSLAAQRQNVLSSVQSFSASLYTSKAWKWATNPFGRIGFSIHFEEQRRSTPGCKHVSWSQLNNEWASNWCTVILWEFQTHSGGVGEKTSFGCGATLEYRIIISGEADTQLRFSFSLLPSLQELLWINFRNYCR